MTTAVEQRKKRRHLENLSKVAKRARLEKLLARKKGVMLDISFGGTPQPRSVTLGPNGDIKHDPSVIPFPLPDDCVHTAVIFHVLEFLAPSQFFAWWDELWRVMQPYGTVHVSGPYGGDESQGWISDPSHQTRVIEQTFAWLDPRMPFYEENVKRGRSKPKPWYPLGISRVPGTHGTISYNATLQKQPEVGK